MTFRELIAAKRDGRAHTREEFDFLAKCAADPQGHGVEDYQLSAWLMAAFLNGLDLDETANLTLAMAESGERLNLKGLPHPWVDKHSTTSTAPAASETRPRLSCYPSSPLAG